MVQQIFVVASHTAYQAQIQFGRIYQEKSETKRMKETCPKWVMDFNLIVNALVQEMDESNR